MFLERERHANVRAAISAIRSERIRTREYLYIRNFAAGALAGRRSRALFAVGPFGDIDGGPTKSLLLGSPDDPSIVRFFDLATARRPAEELYDLRSDPDQLVNVAGRAERRAAQQRLRTALRQWMRDTGDPRATSDDDRWDRYPYYGEPAK